MTAAQRAAALRVCAALYGLAVAISIAAGTATQATLRVMSAVHSDMSSATPAMVRAQRCV